MWTSENTLQNFQTIPSIFEILATEALDELIYPAIKKICTFFDDNLKNLQQCPTKYKVWLAHFLTYLPPVSTWCLQYCYLRKHNASFGERFYNLQRTPLNSDATLNLQQQVISAVLLTSLPYLEDYLKTQEQNHNTSKWQDYLLKLTYIYKIGKVIHLLMYLMAYTYSHSPILHCMKLLLRYPTNASKNQDVATNVLLKFIELLSFFLQLLQSWYSGDKIRKIGGSLVNPPPASNIRNDSLIGLCPICHCSFNNPTASVVTGYVYCWKCIVNHLKRSQECPLSKCAMTIDDLIRIHED